MKKQLQKMFFAFIATAMIFSESANAQIVYTDIIPDSVVSFSNPTYALDINNDGTTDFNIVYTFSSTSACGSASCPVALQDYSVEITPLNSNAVGDNSTGLPFALIYNQLIDSGGFFWSSNANQILRQQAYFCYGSGCGTLSTSGLWTLSTSRYLGLKFISGGNIYFGWAQLKFHGTIGGAFTIIDYAYNSIPNQSILAGDTGTGPAGIIEAIASSSINLFPNPTTNQLTIALGGNNKNVEVTITDLTGKIVYSTKAGETQKIKVDTKDFAEGIYVVQIQTADFVGTKKLVIEK